VSLDGAGDDHIRCGGAPVPCLYLLKYLLWYTRDAADKHKGPVETEVMEKRIRFRLKAQDNRHEASGRSMERPVTPGSPRMRLLARYSAMLAALPLLMGYILGIAETPIADKQMIGQCVCFLWRQQSACLLVDKLAGAVMANRSGWKLAWGFLFGRLLGASAIQPRICLERA